ncbi:DUF362 domain-containing protein [Candidatus Cloacimonadota bacterium]
MNKSKIYFIPLSGKSKLAERCEAIRTILNYLPLDNILEEKRKTGIKTHFGDVNNTTHICPEVIRAVVDKVREYKALPFLMETATLYSGPRNNAVTHIELAYEHGFTYEKVNAPIIMVDGLMGNTEVEVNIPGILFKSVNIARDAVYSDCMIVVSHPTGHIVTGMGACLKNLGMGLATRKGKLKQHSSIFPKIIKNKCTYCLECYKWCPEDAIIKHADIVEIVEDKCIGCGECLSVCKFNAVKYNFAIESVELQKRVAEYAMGAIYNKRDKCLFINVLTDMTAECDCMNIKQKPVIDDVGILAGFDPVAVDQATLDLTRKMNNTDLGRISKSHLDPEIQLEHAEKIGLGNRSYDLIKI